MRTLALGLLVTVFLVGGASPASAHGVGGREPTNVRVHVIGIEPAVADVSVDVVEFGTKLELVNDSDAEVIVLGYAGEPYLRIGPDGAFENRRSPAAFINRTLDPPSTVPDSYDSEAEPQWLRMDSGNSVRWHDHRAHNMTGGNPPEPLAWAVDLTVAGEPVVVRGDIATVAAPAWWPWLLVTAALAAVIALAARRAWRVAVASGLILVLAGEVLHVAGAWRDIASGFDNRLGANAMSVLAVVAVVLALAQVLRRDEYAAAPWVLLAAVVVGVVAAGDVLMWTRSQLPSVFAPAFVRLLVAVALGGALGLAVAAATRLRAPAEGAVEARP